MSAYRKWICGYVKIKIWGFSPERFLNLCTHKGIVLWGIEKADNMYFAKIGLKEFYQLKTFIRKTGCRVVILQRYGLPFLMKKMEKRRVFVWGLLFAVGFWYFSGLFLWNIEVNGNYRLSTDEMLSFLKKEKIYVGVQKKQIDLDQLEKKIRESYPYISWTCARLQGTGLVIDLKENEYYEHPSPERQEETNRGSDLLAIADGEIVSIIVREGIPKVKKGDAVNKHQLLVEGKIPILNEDGTVRYYKTVDADADIVIERTLEKTFTIPDTYVEKEYTGRETKDVYLQFGEQRLVISGRKKFFLCDEIEKENTFLFLKKMGIPITFGKIRRREYRNKEYAYTYENAKEEFLKKNSLFLQSLEEKGVQIIEKNVKIENGNNMWILYDNLRIHDVRTKRAILKQSGEDTINHE